MYTALVRFMRNRSVGVAGTCLAVGALIAAPALAAHMAGTGHSRSLEDASPSSLQSRNRSELLHPGRSADSVAPRAQTSTADLGLSRAPAPEEDRTQEATNVPAREVMTDSIGDFSNFASPDVTAQPAASRSIKARVPGLSDDALARFKKRMYRKDI